MVSSKRRANDPKENYLVLRKNDILYIRRKYKTAKSYGEKVNTFKSRKMRHALQEYVAQQTKEPYKYPFHEPVVLLGKGNGRANRYRFYPQLRAAAYLSELG